MKATYAALFFNSGAGSKLPDDRDNLHLPIPEL
jgi:hypothetical protein